MSLKRICFILTLIICVLPSQAQNILLLEKPGKIKNFKYNEGDKICLDFLNSNNLLENVKGRIKKISSANIIINNNEISLNAIKYIYKDRYFASFMERALLHADLGYFVFIIPNKIINKNRKIIERADAIVIGSLIGSTIMFGLIKEKTYKIDNRKWRIKILNFKDFQSIL